MPDLPLQLKLRIVAGSPHFEDFAALLAGLADAAADVRTSVGIEDDSFAARKAITTYLQKAIDDMKRIRNNDKQRLYGSPVEGE